MVFIESDVDFLAHHEHLKFLFRSQIVAFVGVRFRDHFIGVLKAKKRINFLDQFVDVHPGIDRRQLGQPLAASPYQRRGVRVEFLGIDEEGYEVVPAEGEFVRRPVRMGQIRVVMRDQPFLFYKVTQVFERFQAEILQALITTTGNQVQDFFFVSPEDYARLQGSNFEEFLINRMSTGLMDSVG